MHVVAHRVERGASAVRGVSCTRTRSPSTSTDAQHAEVLDREHRDLGVGHGRRDVPRARAAGSAGTGRASTLSRRRRGHHVAPGCCAGEHLHLGEERARGARVWLPAAAAARAVNAMRPVGSSSSASASTAAITASKPRAQRRRPHRDARRARVDRAARRRNSSSTYGQMSSSATDHAPARLVGAAARAAASTGSAWSRW